MSKLSTSRIGGYVQQLYRLLPRSMSWGRLFQTPESLFVKVADHYPDMDSPYSHIPTTAPINTNTTVLGKLLSIFAIQIMRMDEVVYGLPEESTPTTAVDTLDEWESIYDMDKRTGTIEERQARLGLVFNTRSTPRSTQFVEDFALSKGIYMTMTEIVNPEGNDWFPWSGQWGSGEIGASTIGNYGWGGILRVSISRLDNITLEEAKEILAPEIHHGTMVMWDNDVEGGDVIMTTTSEFTINQTTTATTTITQG